MDKIDKHKLRYEIVKKFDKGNKNLSEDNFDVTLEEFREAVFYLKRENYITGHGFGDNQVWLNQGEHRLTKDGEDYLKENSLTSKTYKAIKEFKDFTKF